jgi:glycine hydroxymethyltransferase
MTTRGLKESEMDLVASWIKKVIECKGNPETLAKIKGEVKALCADFPVYSA